MSRVLWIDATAGVAGDMLLGALHDLGALDGFAATVAAVPALQATVEFTEVTRGGLRAVACRVGAEPDPPPRRLADVLALLDAAAVEPAVRLRSRAAFERLAAAEAAVHATSVDAVHFHEVGAVDAIVDVLGACLGLHRLGVDEIVVSPVGVGAGTADTRHGRVPVPAPAVVRLLADSGLVAAAGLGGFETATPTGVAILAEWATRSGDLPVLRIDAAGTGAGGRDPDTHPNVVRLVVGEAAEGTAGDGEWRVVEANVDDLDPRLWPAALEAVLAAGAADAWLTPILMKKGRPAHTVHALVAAPHLTAVGAALLAHTSTIGFRSYPIAKQAAERRTATVTVIGHAVRVKVTMGPEGAAVTATPEWDDVRSVAEAAGVPPRRVLALAQAAAARLLGTPPGSGTSGTNQPAG